MKLPKIAFPEASSPAGTPKSLWTSVLAATPIILTVFATVLAGLSSSEMTLAQYHRSLAAQNQSKASDQWNFFQAKRIRGTEMQRTVRLLQALSEPGPIDSSALESKGQEVLENLHRIGRDTERLLKAFASDKSELGTGAVSLQQAASRFKDAVAETVKKVEGAASKFKQELARDTVREAVHYLVGKELPPAKLNSIDDSNILQALQAIRTRKPQSEIVTLVAGVTDNALAEAIRQADDTIVAAEDSGKRVAASLDHLDQFVEELTAPPRSLLRSARELKDAVIELPPDARVDAEALAAAAAIASSTETLRTSLNQFHRDFIVAQDNYTVRRYEREARTNEDAAALYEIQIRKNDLTSDRHRHRSKLFFYGMLAAQAGVTISAFSLALKFKSFLWGFASCAGLGAVVFGAYVYLYI
jgi:hypothetical protein